MHISIKGAGARKRSVVVCETRLVMAAQPWNVFSETIVEPVLSHARIACSSIIRLPNIVLHVCAIKLHDKDSVKSFNFSRCDFENRSNRFVLLNKKEVSEVYFYQSD